MNEATCPFCGWEYIDSWELADSGEIECDTCGKLFEYTKDISVTYSCWKKFEDCEHENAHEYKGYFSCHDCETFDKLTPETEKILENL